MSTGLSSKEQCWSGFWETAGPMLFQQGLRQPHRQVHRINSVGSMDMLPDFEAVAEVLRADGYEVWLGKISGEEKVGLVALQERPSV